MLTLKPNELLYAWRRTKKISQAEVAARFGLHQTAISKMEREDLPVNQRILDQIIEELDLTDALTLALMRRRAKLSIRQVSARTGMSETKLSRMESGRRSIDPAYRIFLESAL